MRSREALEAEATRKWVSARYGVDETEPKTVIPDPNKSMDYHSPYPETGLIEKTPPKII